LPTIVDIPWSSAGGRVEAEDKVGGGAAIANLFSGSTRANVRENQSFAERNT
jgi:hypothetical protein